MARRKIRSGKCKAACQKLGRAAKHCKGRRGKGKFQACVRSYFKNH